MYIGQYLPVGSDVYSPWFPREADNAIFTFETIDKDTASSPDLTVKVYHKNTETAGPGAELTAASAFASIDSTKYESGRFTGLKEMVRFKFSVTGSWVLFRMLQPTWYDTAIG